ncbi:hypothetical protein LR48_Vigan10g140300 [Vigna angularis]|uniref:Uncharacterized protein n=1 Tax=Phaseolus angularis TaxID=3914 RepID=A0A0L9VKE4_PHAAN|nr:hypothetical protein LR48_Vigan10g140300 [Vigna angularis]
MHHKPLCHVTDLSVGVPLTGIRPPGLEYGAVLGVGGRPPGLEYGAGPGVRGRPPGVECEAASVRHCTVRPAFFSSWDSATTVWFLLASSVPGARAARFTSTGEKASARSIAASTFVRPPLPFVIVRPAFDKLPFALGFIYPTTQFQSFGCTSIAASPPSPPGRLASKVHVRSLPFGQSALGLNRSLSKGLNRPASNGPTKAPNRDDLEALSNQRTRVSSQDDHQTERPARTATRPSVQPGRPPDRASKLARHNHDRASKVTMPPTQVTIMTERPRSSIQADRPSSHHDRLPCWATATTVPPRLTFLGRLSYWAAATTVPPRLTFLGRLSYWAAATTVSPRLTFLGRLSCWVAATTVPPRLTFLGRLSYSAAVSTVPPRLTFLGRSSCWSAVMTVIMSTTRLNTNDSLKPLMKIKVWLGRFQAHESVGVPLTGTRPPGLKYGAVLGVGGRPPSLEYGAGPGVRGRPPDVECGAASVRHCTVHPAFFSSWDSAATVRFSLASSVPDTRAARSALAGEKASARSIAASTFVRLPLLFVIVRPTFDKLVF